MITRVKSQLSRRNPDLHPRNSSQKRQREPSRTYRAPHQRSRNSMSRFKTIPPDRDVGHPTPPPSPTPLPDPQPNAFVENRSCPAARLPPPQSRLRYERDPPESGQAYQGCLVMPGLRDFISPSPIFHDACLYMQRERGFPGSSDGEGQQTSPTPGGR